MNANIAAIGLIRLGSETEARALYAKITTKLGFKDAPVWPDTHRDTERRRYDAQNTLTTLRTCTDDSGDHAVLHSNGRELLSMARDLCGNYQYHGPLSYMS